MFNIFIKDLCDGPECSPLTNLWLTPNQERHLAQSNVELWFKGKAGEVEHCTKSNLIEFSKEKQKLRCLGQVNPIGSHCLSSSCAGEGMEAMVDFKLNVNEPCSFTANEGNRILRYLRRNMVSSYGKL